MHEVVVRVRVRVKIKVRVRVGVRIKVRARIRVMISISVRVSINTCKVASFKSEDFCKSNYSFKSEYSGKSDFGAKVTIWAKVTQCKSDTDPKIIAFNYNLNNKQLLRFLNFSYLFKINSMRSETHKQPISSHKEHQTSSFLSGIRVGWPCILT